MKKFSGSGFWEVRFLPQDLEGFVGYFIIDKIIYIIFRNLNMAGSCSKENVLCLYYKTKFLQLLQLCLNPNSSEGGSMFPCVIWVSISLSTLATSIPSRPLSIVSYGLWNVTFLPTSQFSLLWSFPLVLDTNPEESVLLGLLLRIQNLHDWEF